VNTITTKDSTKIYLKDWGTGRPVVFSHGWPLTADACDAQILFLGEKGNLSLIMTGAPRSLEPAVERQRNGHQRR